MGGRNSVTINARVPLEPSKYCLLATDHSRAKANYLQTDLECFVLNAKHCAFDVCFVYWPVSRRTSPGVRDRQAAPVSGRVLQIGRMACPQDCTSSLRSLSHRECRLSFPDLCAICDIHRDRRTGIGSSLAEPPLAKRYD